MIIQHGTPSICSALQENLENLAQYLCVCARVCVESKCSKSNSSQHLHGFWGGGSIKSSVWQEILSSKPLLTMLTSNIGVKVILACENHIFGVKLEKLHAHIGCENWKNYMLMFEKSLLRTELIYFCYPSFPFPSEI